MMILDFSRHFYSETLGSPNQQDHKTPKPPVSAMTRPSASNSPFSSALRVNPNYPKWSGRAKRRRIDAFECFWRSLIRFLRHFYSKTVGGDFQNPLYPSKQAFKECFERSSIWQQPVSEFDIPSDNKSLKSIWTWRTRAISRWWFWLLKAFL